MAGTREVKHLRRLKELLAAGRYSPNHLDQQGLCHIHHAVFRGFLLCAKWLHKHGCTLTVRSAEGSVPAHYAAAGGHLECLRWIHKKSSKSISMTDNNGATPLYFAAQEGNLNCLEWLAKHSGTVHWEVSVDGMTAAHAAALGGHLECLEFLFGSAGCRALARDRVANIPLHYAAACGHRSCVEWLLANTNCTGSERNKLGSSPLHVAAQNGHLEVVKLLVRGCAAIKLRDRLGRTPFNVAVESGNEACSELLYQAETVKTDTVRRPFSGNHSLKRVRFESKAIERDSDSARTYESRNVTASDGHGSQERERVTRKPYSLYKHGTENLALLIRPSSVTEDTDVSSQMDRRYTVRVPQSFQTSLEDFQMKSQVTSARLLPWSRVYRMTHSAEAIPSSHQPKVYGSYDRGDVNSKPRNSVVASQHFMSTSYENPSSVKRSSSFLSRFRSGRKNKELFPVDVDQFDDIANNSSQESNVLKRLYKFSKEKVTKSSSFAIENVSDNAKPWRRKNSIVVSGNDDFISRATSSKNNSSISLEEQGDKMYHEKEEVEFLSAETCHSEDSSKSERKQGQYHSEKSSVGRKTRKRISANETRAMCAPRDNSLIW